MDFGLNYSGAKKIIPVFTARSEKNNLVCNRHVLLVYIKTVLNDKNDV